MKALFVVLLIAHVFAAIMFIGGATIAASLFPRYVGWHWSSGDKPGAKGSTVNPAGDPPYRQEQVVRALARITRNYGTGALLVPVLGLILAFVDNRLGEAWLNVSLVLTAGAAFLLIVVVRLQEEQLRLIHQTGAGSEVLEESTDAEQTGAGESGRDDAVDREKAMRRMGLATVSFNLVWLVILVLMVWRPGGHV